MKKKKLAKESDKKSVDKAAAVNTNSDKNLYLKNLYKKRPQFLKIIVILALNSVLDPVKKIKKKKEIVRKLRDLVNGVEDKDTFNKVKELQDLWKKIGQVENSKDRSLWTTYNALLDRFYDNRGIYYELKELDRKKNLELKSAICDKAESLINDTNIMKSVSKLNELHTEFKHVGPISKDFQDKIWDRLKKASDEV